MSEQDLDAIIKCLKNDECACWLQRINYERDVAELMLEKGILAIGFKGWATLEMEDLLNLNVQNARERFDKEFKKINDDKKYGVWRSRYALWSFLCEMKEGDLVIIPRPREFCVFKIMSSAEPIKDNQEGIPKSDLGWQRKVEPLTDWLLREEYADAELIRKMKCQRTNLNISCSKTSIQKVLELVRDGHKPSDVLFSEFTEEVYDRWTEIIEQEFSPDQFEALIKWYLERIGADSAEILSRNTPNKCGDCDVEAVFKKERLIVSVQAKKHSDQTDSWAVTQISEYAGEGMITDEGFIKARWVITSATGFTSDAKEKAEEMNVQLITIRDFVKMLLAAGIDEDITCR